MSASYTSILWNKQKKKYDIGIFLVIVTFLVLFFILNLIINPLITFETLVIRAFGLLAFFMLHVILIIGPLSRLNKRFLIILYNRRHLGVSMFLMAFIHGVFNLVNFHSLGNINPFSSLFLSNTAYDSLVNFPFQVLGFFALIILALMAVTSHDFWLKNLGTKTWKLLHMMVYIAYAMVIFHVILGALQNETSTWIWGMVLAGMAGVISLHIMAAIREIPGDQVAGSGDWVALCPPGEIDENRARIFTLSGERVALFKYDEKISAVNNVCRHQGGPIGEGKIIEGCITCPWHGYQYLPGNGQSPPPFTEKLETYELKLEDGKIWINPVPNPPGTPVEPLKIS